MGPVKTGIGRAFENIINRMSMLNNENEFILFRNKDNFEFSIYGQNIRDIVFNVSKKSPMMNILWHQFIYPLRLLKIKTDISYIPNVTLLIWKACPTVVVIHDLIEFNVPKKFSRLRMFYRHVAVPQTVRRADYIITVSENSKKDIVKYCKVKPEKIKVVYNGVDKRFRPMNKNVFSKVLQKYSMDSPYILYTGTIDHPGKNSISLVRAFRKVADRHPNYKLVFVGKPGFGYDHVINEIESLKLKDRTLMLGYVPDDDLVGIYNGASAFAFLSLYEGFGLPLIEAMACGTPVIAANSSCLPEIVGEAGFIVEPYDVLKIAEYLETLIVNKSLRNEIIQKGFEQAEKFSWEKAAEETLEVFKAVYNERKGK